MYYLWLVRPSRPQEKSGSLIYRHICLMNHEKTHQTNPLAPWDPLDALLTPGTPWQPPNRPPQTHKQVSWPHCTLKITSTASQIIFTFIPVTTIQVRKNAFSEDFPVDFALRRKKTPPMWIFFVVCNQERCR